MIKNISTVDRTGGRWPRKENQEVWMRQRTLVEVHALFTDMNNQLMREYQNKHLGQVNIDQDRILTTTLMPMTLLLIKLDKQSLYQWPISSMMIDLDCFIFILIYSCEPTTVLNVIKFEVRRCKNCQKVTDLIWNDPKVYSVNANSEYD